MGGRLAGSRDRRPILAPATWPLACPLAPMGGDALIILASFEIEPLPPHALLFSVVTATDGPMKNAVDIPKTDEA